MLGRRKRERIVDSLIGQSTEVKGNITFSGGLHIDGTVKGNIYAVDGSDSVLTLSEQGVIEGEIRAPDIVLNGRVKGDVHGTHHIELAPEARIAGNVYYNLLEMAVGAEVNGSLVRVQDSVSKPAQASGQSAKPPEQRSRAAPPKSPAGAVPAAADKNDA